MMQRGFTKANARAVKLSPTLTRRPISSATTISISVAAPSVLLTHFEAVFMLKFILGTYGGYVLGFEKGQFLIGVQSDFPSAWETVAEGGRIEDVVTEFFSVTMDGLRADSRKQILNSASHWMEDDDALVEGLDGLPDKIETLLTPNAGMVTDGSRKLKLIDLPPVVREGLIDYLSK
jgi:hypothetical protein